MLEEVKRKEVDKRDKQLPQSFEQLIQMYDLEKIWKNIDNIIDYTNNDIENSINELNNKAEKNIITITLDNTIANPSVEAYTKVPLTLKESIGNKLSLSENEILIGSGVHHIKVSAKMEFDTGSNTSSRYIRIINGNSVGDNNTIAWCVKEFRANVASFLVIPEVLCSVEEGDLIGLFYYVRNGDKISGNSSILRTWLTIEVVD